jgi:hypothetical protein
MNAEAIKDFVSKIENHDLQSFENEIIQYWSLLQRYDRAIIVFGRFEIEFPELSKKIEEFYLRIDESFNKKKYIDSVKIQAKTSIRAHAAMGYFLLKEEINQKIPGYYRMIFYWYDDCEKGNYNAAKKGFIKHVIKPLSEIIDSEI